ncbi:hypothetical protein L208DRAFT_1398318 [Tricholoma matsutake]|nr:hypothetical protein L208DRAFT_1398318 [Tricholoma matsutake 945]
MSHSTNDLFPVPSSPPSTLIPAQWPGISPESVAALRQVLKDNHDKHHAFFNNQGFHNHSAHRAIAIWALGADAAVIKGGYSKDSSIQLPAFKSPGPVTAANFNDHIGDKTHYNSYLVFFVDAIREEGVAAVVEKYVFSKAANDSPRPRMLDHFLGGLIHPMIHVGYGLEFRLPGMVAQGLAQASVHADFALARIPASFFENSFISSALDQAAARLKSVMLSADAMPGSSGLHTFSILARVLKDPEFGTIADDGEIYATSAERFGETLRKLIDQWQIDTTNAQDVERKIEELSWMNVMIYGIGGWQKGQPFNADFFIMHIVTSSIFLPSFVAYLTPSSQELLLRSYLFVSLTWWIARGRPSLNIAQFFASTKPGPSPAPTSKHAKPHESAVASSEFPNPWLPIIANTVIHPDDHHVKLQRAIVHYGMLYGKREAGREDFKQTELEGAEKLDGSLFIRVAGLTHERLGRVLEGEENNGWERTGFYQSGEKNERYSL